MTREQAVAALAEVSARASQIRHADYQLRRILLAILVADIGVGILVSLGPQHGSRLVPLAIIGVLVGALVVGVAVWLRIRAYSRAGIRIYFATLVMFNIWNALVVSASIATGFFSKGQPTYHFGIASLFAVLPLLVGAALVGRRT